MIGNTFLKDVKFLQKYFGWRQVFSLRILPTLKYRFFRINYYKSFNKSMLVFLEKEFENIINEYKEDEHLFSNNSLISNLPIWICWWQGESHMPTIVSKCYEYLKENSNDRKVILITKSNYKLYTNIPSSIIKKVDNEKISLTHLSDIIRVNLLKNYGGLWIDASIWVTQPIELPNLSLFTIKQNLESDSMISNNLWTIGILGTNKDNILISFIHDCLIKYWEKYDRVIVYFLMDYVFKIAYNNFKTVEDMVNKVPYSSNNLHIMKKIINDQYKKEKMDKIISENTFLSLSWKINLLNNTNDNKLTNYDFFLNNKININEK